MARYRDCLFRIAELELDIYGCIVSDSIRDFLEYDPSDGRYDEWSTADIRRFTALMRRQTSLVHEQNMRADWQRRVAKYRVGVPVR